MPLKCERAKNLTLFFFRYELVSVSILIGEVELAVVRLINRGAKNGSTVFTLCNGQEKAFFFGNSITPNSVLSSKL